jgi:hypothetical protein
MEAKKSDLSEEMGDRGFDLLIYVFDPSRWRYILRSDVELTILNFLQKTHINMYFKI